MEVYGIQQGFFRTGHEEGVVFAEAEIVPNLYLVKRKGYPPTLQPEGTPPGYVFEPVPLNLGGNIVEGQRGHAGNVGWDLEKIGNLVEVRIPIMRPIAFENIKIIFDADKVTPADIPTA